MNNADDQKEKHMYRRCIAFVIAALLLTGAACAEGKRKNRDRQSSPEIKIACIFCDGMVLQRGKEVRIFGGGGRPGDTVTVEFAGQSVSSLCHEDSWEVILAPMDVCAQNREMRIIYTLQGESEPHQTVTIKKVLVGEVWMGSGQSNMTLTINEMTGNAGQHPEFIEDYKQIGNWDMMRFFTVPYGASDEPKQDYSRKLSWSQYSNYTWAANVSGLAVAYASQLQEMLGENIPVGIIISAVGGSCIEEWLDSNTMADLPSHAAVMGKKDSRFYNRMIYPFQGYAIRGILWYQGEANALWSEDYRMQFEAYLRLYRDIFHDAQLPCIVMQLPQYTDGYYPAFRQMQWDTMKEDENVYVICGIDLGDCQNIHPVDKYPFAGRAAGAALSEIYGGSPVEGRPFGLSPSITGARYTGEGIILTADSAQNLLAPEPIEGFRIKNGSKWEKTTAHMKDGQIIVDCGGIKPSAISYLQDGYFVKIGFVYNEYGLPLTPAACVEIEY